MTYHSGSKACLVVEIVGVRFGMKHEQAEQAVPVTELVAIAESNAVKRAEFGLRAGRNAASGRSSAQVWAGVDAHSRSSPAASWALMIEGIAHSLA
jgi:hypothetical protein